jgi:hypothetical protein
MASAATFDAATATAVAARLRDPLGSELFLDADLVLSEDALAALTDLQLPAPELLVPMCDALEAPDVALAAADPMTTRSVFGAIHGRPWIPSLFEREPSVLVRMWANAEKLLCAPAVLARLELALFQQWLRGALPETLLEGVGSEGVGLRRALLTRLNAFAAAIDAELATVIVRVTGYGAVGVQPTPVLGPSIACSATATDFGDIAQDPVFRAMRTGAVDPESTAVDRCRVAALMFGHATGGEDALRAVLTVGRVRVRVPNPVGHVELWKVTVKGAVLAAACGQRAPLVAEGGAKRKATNDWEVANAATAMGHTELLRWLLTGVGRVRAWNHCWSALATAREHGHADTIALLEGPPFVPTSTEELEHAIDTRNTAAVRFITERKRTKARSAVRLRLRTYAANVLRFHRLRQPAPPPLEPHPLETRAVATGDDAIMGLVASFVAAAEAEERDARAVEDSIRRGALAGGGKKRARDADEDSDA